MKFNTNNPFMVDYIIITNNLTAGTEQLIKLFDFKEIIIDSSNNYRTVRYWKEECRVKGIDPIIIYETGAFISEL